MKKSKYEPIHDFIGFEDLLQKSGYKQFQPRISNLGRALLQASNNQRSNNFLKRYWDSYFKKLRDKRKTNK